VIEHLSIIIPTLNEETYLPALLESIVLQEFSGKLQIIVVDGYSKDETAAIAENFCDRLLDMTVVKILPGIGAQRNLGASLAKYDYFLFVDADVILPPNTLKSLSVRTRTGRPFVGAVPHVGSHMTTVDYLVLMLTYFLLGIAWIARVPVTNGDFILTTKENHEQLARGFTEGALIGEDTDYGLRSVRAGARYKFYRGIHIIASDRRVREMGRARLLLLWSRVFLHVIRHGPVFPGQGIDYSFGHYGPKRTGQKDSAETLSRKRGRVVYSPKRRP
jgi:glycosyltransferase involved in cell wall biosynthesis